MLENGKNLYRNGWSTCQIEPTDSGGLKWGWEGGMAACQPPAPPLDFKSGFACAHGNGQTGAE